jgi:membrane associated rhomboid family serine protease
MLIVPYATDAPIYHFPKATLGMIVINVAIHFAWIFSGPESAEPYVMVLGSGLHPIQWLSHNFLHANLIHLIGNMIFLWSYGIIVEGKIGWLPFSLLYVAIGIMHGAAIQFAYLGASEPSLVLGASGIIFGLMAICMVWAPVNELSVFYLFIIGFRIISNTIEARIYVFAILQIVLQCGETLMAHLRTGDPMSSGFLHISGAFWGLIGGLLLLKTGLVDCEGYDVLSLMTKRRALREAWKAREARLDHSKQTERLPKSSRVEEDRPTVSPEERAAKLLAKLHRAIELGDMPAAQLGYEKWIASIGKRAPREQLLGVVNAMHAQNGFVASVPAMRALCRFYPERADKVRLKLASILIRELQRPTEAHRQLQQIAVANLEPGHQRLRQKLLDEAAVMIEDGVLEVEEDA